MNTKFEVRLPVRVEKKIVKAGAEERKEVTKEKLFSSMQERQIESLQLKIINKLLII